MALKDKYFDPKLYYYKVIILCVFICIDIVFSSFTQFADFGNTKTKEKYNLNKDCITYTRDMSWGFFGLQMAFQVLLIFTLLSIFSQTIFFRQGMLGEICGKFYLTFIFVLLYPIMFFVERIIRYMKLSKKEENLSHIEFLDSPVNYICYTLKYLCAFLFYIFTLNTGFELGKVKYYKIESNFGIPY